MSQCLMSQYLITQYLMLQYLMSQYLMLQYLMSQYLELQKKSLYNFNWDFIYNLNWFFFVFCLVPPPPTPIFFPIFVDEISFFFSRYFLPPFFLSRIIGHIVFFSFQEIFTTILFSNFFPAIFFKEGEEEGRLGEVRVSLTQVALAISAVYWSQKTYGIQASRPSSHLSVKLMDYTEN